MKTHTKNQKASAPETRTENGWYICPDCGGYSSPGHQGTERCRNYKPEAPQSMETQYERDTRSLRDLANQYKASAERLAEALREIREVCERVGAPPIQQGTLCEEQDWQTVMRTSRDALAEWKARAQ